MKRGFGLGMRLAQFFGLLLVLAFAGWSPAARAASPYCQATSATLSMPSSITVQPNAAAGPIANAVGTATIVFSCGGLPASTAAPDYTATIQAGQYLAKLDSTNNTSGPGITFATNITGLAILVTATPVQATSRACLACGPTSTAGYVPGSVIAPSGTTPGTYSGTVTANYTAQLVKTISGAISPGTIAQTSLIPFWWYIPGGSVDSTSLSLNASLIFPSTIITVPTCTVTAGNNQTVSLPTVDASQLSSNGKVAGTTPFNIVVSGCPDGVSVATNTFSGGSVDTNTGNLKNTTSTANGGARNVEVQVLNGPGTTATGPIIFGKSSASTQNSGTFNIVDNAVTLNYYAQYYATGAVGAGAVTATINYTISYQ
jgi:type 1 fimbria pilin